LSILNNPETYGILAAFFAVLIYIPQLMQIFKTRKTRDLNILFLIFIIICNIFWMINGYMSGSISRFLSGLIISLMTLPMFWIKINNIKNNKDN